MEFPKTFEEFAKDYGFKDDKKVYTNGSDLIQILRVKQWIYESDKRANKWIPVSEELPKVFEHVNVTCHSLIDNREDWVVETVYVPQLAGSPYSDWGNIPMLNWGQCEVVAWMHREIPEPYKAESEGK
jgi:hypothetical protein